MAHDDRAKEACAECGARACRELFDLLLALEFQTPDPYGRLHGVTVPAYLLQHPSSGLTKASDQRDHWTVLQVYADWGLVGLDRLTRRRVAANSPRRTDPSLPPFELPSGVIVPDSVPADFTIADVAGEGRGFHPSGHQDRVSAWVHHILGRTRAG